MCSKGIVGLTGGGGGGGGIVGLHSFVIKRIRQGTVLSITMVVAAIFVKW